MRHDFDKLVSVCAGPLTTMKPISHRVLPGNRTRGQPWRREQKLAFRVSGVPFAPDKSSAAMFLPANEKRECANWQAGARTVCEVSQERAARLMDARPRYGRPEIESHLYEAGSPQGWLGVGRINPLACHIVWLI